MSEELKLCPFCGGPGITKKLPNCDVWTVDCAEHPSHSAKAYSWESREEAIANWNSRAKLEESNRHLQPGKEGE